MTGMGKQQGPTLFLIPVQHLEIERLIRISAIRVQSLLAFLTG